jgi:hypothetical protein
MKSADIIIVHPDNQDKLEALKTFLKAFKIKFEVPTKEKPYDPEFVAKILQGDEDFKKGNFKVIKTKDLWK